MSVTRSSPQLIVHLVSARSEEAFATREVITTAAKIPWTASQMHGPIAYQTLNYEKILMYLTFPVNQGPDFMLSHIKECLQFFQPDLCIMTGICAGQRGKIHLGDVVVATGAFNYERGRRTDEGHQAQPMLFASDGLDTWLPWIQATMSIRPWDAHTIQKHPKSQTSTQDFFRRVLYEYQNGVEKSKWLWAHGFDRSKSIVENKTRIPDYDRNLKNLVSSGEVEIKNLQLQLSRAVMHKIQTSIAIYGDSLEPSDRRMKSKVEYGVYASGSGVDFHTITRKYQPWGSENPEAEERVSRCFEEARRQYRDITAVDMEGAAFYQALQGTGIKAVCVKGISDYGDHEKDDVVHQYAKEAAASFSWELIGAYCEIYGLDSDWRLDLASEDLPLRRLKDRTTQVVFEDLLDLVELLILTSTEVEFQAVFQLLEPPSGQGKILWALHGNNMYYLGRYGHYKAVLLATSQTGVTSETFHVSEAVRLFQCQLVVNVGVAWGVDSSKQRLGDVLVANRLINVDFIERTSQETIEGSAVLKVDSRIDAIVHAVVQSWNEKTQIHIGLILKSSRLLNDPKLKRWLIERYPEAIGGEIELSGVHESADFGNVPWIIVKGISDWADGIKHDDYHQIAARNAAAFFHAICRDFRNLVQGRHEFMFPEDSRIAVGLFRSADGPASNKPYVRVKITSPVGEGSVEASMRMDPTADITCIPLSIATQLGLPVAKKTKISIIGGEILDLTVISADIEVGTLPKIRINMAALPLDHEVWLLGANFLRLCQQTWSPNRVELRLMSEIGQTRERPLVEEDTQSTNTDTESSASSLVSSVPDSAGDMKQVVGLPDKVAVEILELRTKLRFYEQVLHRQGQEIQMLKNGDVRPSGSQEEEFAVRGIKQEISNYELTPSVSDTSTDKCWKQRLEILQPVINYLSSFENLISAGLAHDPDADKTPLVILYCQDPYKVQQQRKQTPYLDASQKFVVCRPGDITYLDSDLEPPSLESVDSDVLSAFNLTHQGLFQRHSNITVITTGYHYSESAQAWSTDLYILVYVYKKGYIPWGEDPIPKMIEGKPTKVLEGVCYPCARAGGEYRYINPVAPGVSIGVQRSTTDEKGEVVDTWATGGTLGAFLTDESNKPYFLTNCHVVDIGCVFHPKFVDLDEAVQQPSLEDLRRFNREAEDQRREAQQTLLDRISQVSRELLNSVSNALQKTSPDKLATDYNIGSVVEKTRKNIVHDGKLIGLDLAICQYKSGREWKADPQIPKHDVPAVNYTYSPKICTLNEELKSAELVKKGRTTDTRYGILQNPKYGTTSIAQHSFLGDYLFAKKNSDELLCTCENKTEMQPVRTVLYNQYVARGKGREGFGDPGDSGSVCYLIEGDQIRPVGLYHSNITNFPYPAVMSPIGAVMEYLQKYRFADPN